MNTKDYLEQIKNEYGISSKYGLAKKLGISRQAVTRYYEGGTFSDDVAESVAELLQIDPAIIFIEMQAERTNCQQHKDIWQRIAQQMCTALSIVFIMFLLPTEPVHAGTAPANSLNTGYTLCELRRRINQLLKLLSNTD